MSDLPDTVGKALVEKWLRERDIRYTATDSAPTWADLQDLVYRIDTAVETAKSLRDGGLDGGDQSVRL